MQQLKQVQALILVLLFTKVFSCLEQSLSPSEWMTDDDIENFRTRYRDDEKTVILVAQDFVLNCEGSISQWTIKWHHRDAWIHCATVGFNFYVFRQAEECGTLITVGENSFTVTISQSGDSERQFVQSIFGVNPEDRITAQSGDFIGVAMSLLTVQCSDVRVRVAGIQDLQFSNTLYHGLFSSLNQGLMSAASQPCSALETDESIIPFISAVVNRTSAPTTTSHRRVPTPTTSQPLLRGATTPVSGGFVKESESQMIDVHVHPSSLPLAATSLGSNNTDIESSSTSHNIIGTSHQTNTRQKEAAPSSVTYVVASGGAGTSAVPGDTQKSREQLVLIGMGAASCALFLLVVSITSTVLFLLRYWKPKKHYDRKQQHGCHNQQNFNDSTVNEECMEHGYEDIYQSTADVDLNSSHSQPQGYRTSLSLQPYAMTTNRCYSSITKSY